MYFDSLQALLHMEGHGIYVWMAYLVTVAVITAVLIVPLRRRRQFLVQLAAEASRAQTAPGASGDL